MDDHAQPEQVTAVGLANSRTTGHGTVPRSGHLELVERGFRGAWERWWCRVRLALGR